jgi:hypothetical protein
VGISSTLPWFEYVPNDDVQVSDGMFDPRLALLIRFSSLSILLLQQITGLPPKLTNITGMPPTLILITCIPPC